MRTSLRVFAAALSTLLAAAFLVVVPFGTPAHALAQFHVLNIQNASVNENGGSIDVLVAINQPPIPFADNITATVKTESLSAIETVPPGVTATPDYTATSQAMTWNTGNYQDNGLHTISIPIANDGTPEPNEQFRIVFSAINGATPGTVGTVTINQDAADVGTIPTISATGGESSAEGTNAVDGTRQVTVHLDDIHDQDVTVNVATKDGTAIAPGDYTAVTTTMLKWDKDDPLDDKNINIPIERDEFGEPSESFQLIFGSNSNAALAPNVNQTFTLTNDDADTPVISVGDIPPVSEGDSGTKILNVPITVTPAPEQPISVEINTTDGSAIASTQDTTGDYVPVVKQVVNFGIGQTTKDVPVTLVGDIAQEPDETFKVTASAPNNATLGVPEKNATIQNDDFGQITTGVGPGGGPHVRNFGAQGADLGGFFAYEAAFTGGVHVARGDFFKADGSVGADGVDEIVTAPNKNSRPLVRVFALDGTIRASFFAFDQNFAGGVYIAAGNFDGDVSNGDELVVAAGPGGGPHVKVIKIKGPGDNILDISNGGFYAYAPDFHGGVRLAAANMTGDSKDEIITGPGAGGGPHVRVFGLNNQNSFAETSGFMAYGPEFAGGVFVAAAAGKIVTGAGAGGGPHVRVFNANGSADGTGFYAYGPEFHGGVFVAMGNLDNDPAAEVVTGPGAGGGPHVRAFNQDGSEPFGTGFFAYQNFTGGVEVAVGGGGN